MSEIRSVSVHASMVCKGLPLFIRRMVRGCAGIDMGRIDYVRWPDGTAVIPEDIPNQLDNLLAGKYREHNTVFLDVQVVGEARMAMHDGSRRMEPVRVYLPTVQFPHPWVVGKVKWHCERLSAELTRVSFDIIDLVVEMPDRLRDFEEAVYRWWLQLTAWLPCVSGEAFLMYGSWGGEPAPPTEHWVADTSKGLPDLLMLYYGCASERAIPIDRKEQLDDLYRIVTTTLEGGGYKTELCKEDVVFDKVRPWDRASTGVIREIGKPCMGEVGQVVVKLQNMPKDDHGNIYGPGVVNLCADLSEAIQKGMYHVPILLHSDEENVLCRIPVVREKDWEE